VSPPPLITSHYTYQDTDMHQAKEGNNTLTILHQGTCVRLRRRPGMEAENSTALEVALAALSLQHGLAPSLILLALSISVFLVININIFMTIVVIIFIFSLFFVFFFSVVFIIVVFIFLSFCILVLD